MVWFYIVTGIYYFILCLTVEGLANKKGCKGYFFYALLFSPLFAVLMLIAEPNNKR